MKLSDAIRAGSKLAPQTTGGRYAVFNYGEVDGTCALGAAIHSAFGVDSLRTRTNRGVLSSEMITLWSQKGPFTCPQRNCEHAQPRLITMIYHLNDDHEWTRESIAEWIDEFVFEQSCEASKPLATELITVQQ